jgi:hypothetical protein
VSVSLRLGDARLNELQEGVNGIEVLSGNEPWQANLDIANVVQWKSKNPNVGRHCGGADAIRRRYSGVHDWFLSVAYRRDCISRVHFFPLCDSTSLRRSRSRSLAALDNPAAS